MVIQETEGMQVVFNAAGHEVFHETLGIDVEHRCSTDSPDGILFTLLAESCVPGIEFNRVQSMFEEHTIKKELDPFAPLNNEYGIQDKVMLFLRIIAYCTHHHCTTQINSTM
jgi:hypothetical protein